MNVHYLIGSDDKELWVTATINHTTITGCSSRVRREGWNSLTIYEENRLRNEAFIDLGYKANEAMTELKLFFSLLPKTKEIIGD